MVTYTYGSEEGADEQSSNPIRLKRRSTRKFTDEPVTKAELDMILHAALLAPTSMNRKPCNFMVVERKDALKELSQSKDHGADLIKGAIRRLWLWQIQWLPIPGLKIHPLH